MLRIVVVAAAVLTAFTLLVSADDFLVGSESPVRHAQSHAPETVRTGG